MILAINGGTGIVWHLDLQYDLKKLITWYCTESTVHWSTGCWQAIDPLFLRRPWMSPDQSREQILSYSIQRFFNMIISQYSFLTAWPLGFASRSHWMATTSTMWNCWNQEKLIDNYCNPSTWQASKIGEHGGFDRLNRVKHKRKHWGWVGQKFRQSQEASFEPCCRHSDHPCIRRVFSKASIGEVIHSVDATAILMYEPVPFPETQRNFQGIIFHMCI